MMFQARLLPVFVLLFSVSTAWAQDHLPKAKLPTDRPREKAPAKTEKELNQLSYALSLAVISGDVKEFHRLVEKEGAPIHARADDDEKRAPLNAAAEYGELDIVAYLLSKKVDPNNTRKLYVLPLGDSGATGESVTFKVNKQTVEILKPKSAKGGLPLLASVNGGSFFELRETDFTKASEIAADILAGKEVEVDTLGWDSVAGTETILDRVNDVLKTEQKSLKELERSTDVSSASEQAAWKQGTIIELSSGARFIPRKMKAEDLEELRAKYRQNPSNFDYSVSRQENIDYAKDYIENLKKTLKLLRDAGATPGMNTAEYVKHIHATRPYTKVRLASGKFVESKDAK